MEKKKRKRRVVNYKEGDWIGVPLENGGYALGLIARAKRGILFGYFFGPKHTKLVDIVPRPNLSHTDAVLLCQFGDMGLLDGEWKVIARSDPWSRELWPMPLFGRVDALEEEAWLVRYDEDNPNHEISETPCSIEEAERFPEDCLSGSGAVEIKLAMLLS